MARIRSVHPDICQSEKMASLPAHLERTFVRLWTHCDDEGRCLDNPRLIKAALYPLNDEITWTSIDDELTELQREGLVLRYETGQGRVLAIRSWDEYQHPQKPRPSQYSPPPEGYAKRTRRLPEGDGNHTGLEKEMEKDTGEGDGDIYQPKNGLTTPRARELSNKRGIPKATEEAKLDPSVRNPEAVGRWRFRNDPIKYNAKADLEASNLPDLLKDMEEEG